MTKTRSRPAWGFLSVCVAGFALARAHLDRIGLMLEALLVSRAATA